MQEKTLSLDKALDDVSSEELQRTINNFDSVMQQRNQQLHGLRKQADTVQTSISQLRSQIDQLNLKKGQIVMLQDQAKQLREQQVYAGNNLQRKYTLPALPSISSSTGCWSAVILRNFTQNFNNEVFVLYIYVIYVITLI